jgi:hypothetical protein
MRTVHELTQDELEELSGREEMTIEELMIHFTSTMFTEEDFFCNL